MQNDNVRQYLHLHVIVFIWGFTAVLGALITIDAIPLVWYRMLLASIFIALFIAWRKIGLRFKTLTLLGFALSGLIIAVHWITFFGAIKVSNVSVTLAVMSTGAFFTSLLEPLFFKRKVIGYEVFFGILVVAGLYLIFDLETDYTEGILLALAASFLGALFSVINGRYAQQYKAAAITFYELLAGVACITLYLLIEGRFTTAFFQLSGTDWGYLLLLASACTAYAFIASVHVMRWLSPYTVMLTINLEPVYGILLALLILGSDEYMSPQFYYGAGLILITVIANGILKVWKRKRQRKAAT
ncbi:DMT family transporter [Altibacter sp. HG106]|uniref:DMT family transporter n=1 Tax=Altibacter sp. HG106 TaxID=3023937 RepID=UPI00234FCE1C|nr:DMT family transporter [Altibacter sp. HG106]MDC7996301.1 DMT family transporter [Altibacter sp. HG106]